MSIWIERKADYEYSSLTLDLSEGLDEMELAPGDIVFLVLQGSGAGVQYIFQGTFDLGEGSKNYNFALYAYKDRSYAHGWDVKNIEGGAMFSVTNQVAQKGLELARKLARTLPNELDLSFQMNHPTQVVIQGWEDAEFSRDEK